MLSIICSFYKLIYRISLILIISPMKFSSLGERVLKEYFSSHNKTEMVSDLDDKIAKMEEGIMNFLKSDYSQLIDECSYLEDLKEKMNDIRLVNTDVSRIANGLSISVKYTAKDESELDKYADRIAICQREMKTIEKFLELMLDVEKLIEKLKSVNENNVKNIEVNCKSNVNKLNSDSRSNSSNFNGTSQGQGSIRDSRSSAMDQETSQDPRSSTMDQESIRNPRSSSFNQGRHTESNPSDSASHSNAQDQERTAESQMDIGSQSSINSLSNTVSRLSISNQTSEQLASANSVLSRSNNSKIVSEQSISFENVATSSIHFKITTDLVKMNSLIGSFAKFYFQTGFKNNLENIRNNYKNIVFKDIERLISMNWCAIGANLNIEKSFSICDSITNNEFIPDFAITSLFSIKLIGLEKEATDFINKVRKVSFDIKRSQFWRAMQEVNSDQNKNALNSTDDLVYFYIGFMLLSNLVSKHFKKCLTFHCEIFSDLSNLKTCSPSAISKLRKLAQRLSISNAMLDSSIENLVFNYVDSSFKHPDILKYNNEKILQNIKKCINFVNEINQYSGEFNELLTRKIDDSFIFILNNSPIDVYFDRVTEINNFNIELKKNEIFKNAKFDNLKELDRSLMKVAEKEVEDLALFSSKKTTEEIVKRIIEIGSKGTAGFRNKFVEIFESKAPQMYSTRSKEDRAVILDSARRNLLNK